MSSTQAERDAAFETIERQRAAAAIQRRRLEWALYGSTRDLQKYTQQQPLQLDNLIETLELALAIGKELRGVREALAEVDEGPF
jgi:hypothetical protein